MRLKKYRGQHLLTDKNMLNRIIRESDVDSKDNIIEIGAGTGLLTEMLVENASKVVAFEVDKDLEENLMDIESRNDNLTIVMGDFLKCYLREFFKERSSRWKVVANIPYNITTPIIQKLVNEGRLNIDDIYLLIQKEVAQRIIAKPGGKDYGRLSVFTQFFYDCSIMFIVPPDVFVPPPKVESAFLHMQPKMQVLDVNPSIYFSVVEAAFGQRRKQIRNALKKGIKGIKAEELDIALKSANIEARRRGETLSLEEFANLSREIEKNCKGLLRRFNGKD